LIQSAFSLGELQILNGELGTCMGEFNKAMVEFFGEGSVLASEILISR